MINLGLTLGFPLVAAVVEWSEPPGWHHTGSSSGRSGRQKQDGEGIVAQGRKGCNVLAFYFLER